MKILFKQRFVVFLCLVAMGTVGTARPLWAMGNRHTTDSQAPAPVVQTNPGASTSANAQKPPLQVPSSYAGAADQGAPGDRPSTTSPSNTVHYDGDANTLGTTSGPSGLGGH